METDRRVRRTHRLLRDALIALVLERGWEAVSVQDVCERADVGRSTFYTHFGDKEALLTSGFEGLREELLPHVRAGDRLAFLEPLADHVAENARLFRALVGQKSGQVVQRKFRALLVDLVGADLGDDADDVTVRFVAGALFEVLTWWLDGRSPMTPAELAARSRALVAASLGG